MPCRLPGGGATIDVTDADMALIAAAPVLLEALEGLLNDCVEYCRINNLFNNDGGPGSNHGMRQARAAIAKATGTAGERA